MVAIMLVSGQKPLAYQSGRGWGYVGALGASTVALCIAWTALFPIRLNIMRACSTKGRKHRLGSEFLDV